MGDESVVSYEEIRRRADPSVAHLLQFFEHKHLPVELAAVSAPFCDLAYRFAAVLPANPETTVMLRKLIEAKDCAVRCAIATPRSGAARDV